MTTYVFTHKSERKDQADDGYRDGKAGIPAQAEHRADLYDVAYSQAYLEGYLEGERCRAYLIKKGEMQS